MKNSYGHKQNRHDQTYTDTMNKQLTTLFLTVFLKSIFPSLSAAQSEMTTLVFRSCTIKHASDSASRNFHQLLESLENTLPEPENLSAESTITIPVVFHILYRTPQENISDVQILEQLHILNQDFNKRATEYHQTPSPFQNLIADCGIEFKLATKTPSGEATKGITRFQTNKLYWSTNNDIKKSEMGGISPWNTKKYLNIWVCRLGNGNLGYSTYPFEPQQTDGIVIDFSAFGTTGTARAPFNKGRTLVHETGHWLGLMHIWGDSPCGDDHIHDTPKHSQAHFGNITTPTYAQCQGFTQLAMTMNFMDYVNDNSMWMFTFEQKSRMRKLLTKGGYRHSITLSAEKMFGKKLNKPKQVSQQLALLSGNHESHLTNSAASGAELFSVFPNPVQDFATIKLHDYRNLKENTHLEIYVFDAFGNRCIYEKIDANKVLHELDFSTFKPGLHFVEVIYNDGTSSIKKVMKMSSY
jgi:hypothetical protein